MFKKEYVYGHADEKYVRTLKVYADGSNKLFYDAEFKNAVLDTTIEHEFLAGLTIVVDGKQLVPLCYSEGTVTCHNGESTVTFTVKTAE